MVKIDNIDKIKLENQLKKGITKAMMGMGWDKEMIPEYSTVELETGVNDSGYRFLQVQVRAELGYEDLTELADALNPIVQRIDDEAYFEPVEPGIMDAWIFEENEIWDKMVEVAEKFVKLNRGKVRADSLYDALPGEMTQWCEKEYYYEGDVIDKIVEMSSKLEYGEPDENGEMEVVLKSRKLESLDEAMSYEEARDFMKSKGLNLPKDIYNMILNLNNIPNDMEMPDNADESLNEATQVKEIDNNELIELIEDYLDEDVADGYGWVEVNKLRDDLWHKFKVDAEYEELMGLLRRNFKNKLQRVGYEYIINVNRVPEEEIEKELGESLTEAKGYKDMSYKDMSDEEKLVYINDPVIEYDESKIKVGDLWKNSGPYAKMADFLDSLPYDEKSSNYLNQARQYYRYYNDGDLPYWTTWEFKGGKHTLTPEGEFELEKRAVKAVVREYKKQLKKRDIKESKGPYENPNFNEDKFGKYFDDNNQLIPELKGEYIKAVEAEKKSKKLDEKLIEPEEEDINYLEARLDSMGFNIEGKGKTMISKRLHYQLRSKLDNMDEADLNYMLRKLDRLTDKLDERGIPMTYSVDLGDDGYITAGIDLMKKRVPDKEEGE